MGNRAVITTKQNFENNGVGVYVHWNGGRLSVESFLEYCKRKGYREPEYDNYGWARLCQVIGNFFGGELSVGIDTVDKLDCDNWDNGVYIIENWKIVDRKFVHSSYEPKIDEEEKEEFIRHIDSCMPENDRLYEKEDGHCRESN